MKQKINYIKSNSRFLKQLLMVFFDSFLVILMLELAFIIRLGELFFPEVPLLFYMLSVPIIAIPIFATLGLYRTIIRYIGFKELWTIIQSASLYVILFTAIIFLLAAPFDDTTSGFFPRSVLLIYWLLMIVSLLVSRMLARWSIVKLYSKKNILNVVIYGAGVAGRELSIALSQSNQYKPVALVDDASELQKHRINGLEVFSPDNLSVLIHRRKIKEILIALPSISISRRREIINNLEQYQVQVRSVPSISELARGNVEISHLTDLTDSDLLGRELVNSEKNIKNINVKDKIVLVTGAGGSIGSELCRQILKLKPKRLVLFEISEVALYTIHKDLMKIEENINILPVLGSVTSKKRIYETLKRYSVNTIYHAAAYKHVPMIEFNYFEGINNNIFGTLNCAQAAIDNGVETFVLISTDKAVRPANVMGASKRVAELILQAFAKQSHSTCFTMVRFGNVLNSSGSVIPLFKKQIKEGGPITVTHADIVRYFMSIPEAVELVIQAGAMAKGGEVFVLDMGKPIRILIWQKK